MPIHIQADILVQVVSAMASILLRDLSNESGFLIARFIWSTYSDLVVDAYFSLGAKWPMPTSY